MAEAQLQLHKYCLRNRRRPLAQGACRMSPLPKRGWRMWRRHEENRPQEQRPKVLLEKNKMLYFFLLSYWPVWFYLLHSKLFPASVIEGEHQQLQPIGFALVEYSALSDSTLSKIQFHILSASSLQNSALWMLLFSSPWSIKTYACVTNRWVFLWLSSMEALRRVRRTWTLLSFSKRNQLSTGNYKHVPGPLWWLLRTHAHSGWVKPAEAGLSQEDIG